MYGLQMLRPVQMSEETMQAFHSREYIEFLKNVTPENQERYSKEVKSFSFVNDCPVFERIFDYCQVRGSLGPGKKGGCAPL